jgi:hypothetical protein
MYEILESAVLRSAGNGAADWFRENLASDDLAGSTVRFRAVFAGVQRRLGDFVLELRPDDISRLQQAGLVEPARWRLDTFARAALLIRALQLLPAGQHAGFVRAVYLRGDFSEQVTVLKVLMLLPDPGRFVATAVDACRTNVRDVFEAIACENRYPATYFPEPNFNQLVVKAFFIGIAVSRIAGLEQRKTPELRRMAEDYASERRAAGRSVPADLDLVLG